MISDLSDDEARRALVLKWGAVEQDVIPAWVAEMDYALAPPVRDALAEAVERGVTGYPALDGSDGLADALAGFAKRHWNWTVDPGRVRPVSDVTAGIRVALEVLSESAPMVLPLPAYPPQLSVAEITGRRRVDLVLDPDSREATIDLDRLDSLLRAGARTLLLTQPHNPWGRVFTRSELEGIRDVVVRHGARVISDEIHAPLVLPGSDHVPYLSLEGTSGHAVAVVAASKAFNTAGLRCAQIVSGDDETARRVRDVPDPLNDSWSPLGVVAGVAAYVEGDAWLAALVSRLADQRALLQELLAAHLPEVRMRPLEATYLAWLDVRAYGHADPAAVALEQGRVRLEPGQRFDPDLDGHARLNVATSPERLREVVRRLAAAWTQPADESRRPAES